MKYIKIYNIIKNNLINILEVKYTIYLIILIVYFIVSCSADRPVYRNTTSNIKNIQSAKSFENIFKTKKLQDGGLYTNIDESEPSEFSEMFKFERINNLEKKKSK